MTANHLKLKITWLVSEEREAFENPKYVSYKKHVLGIFWDQMLRGRN